MRHLFLFTLLFGFMLCSVGCQTSSPIVKEVISADTIILSNGKKIRYAGLTAPPKESTWFKLCKEANAYLVLNKTVQLTTEVDLSKDGIILAYLYTPVFVGKETKYLFVNAEMVRFGFAQALPVPPECKKKELWQTLWNLQEQEAKPLKKGIWSGKNP
jgi:endonuclease YncB( thermonuclease family)